MEGPHNMDVTYGAMYVGLLIATFFQGVLTVQAYFYFENYPKDPRTTKGLVIAVWIIDLLHLILIAQSGYHYFIREWGNSTALMYSTQELNLHVAAISLATLICKAFFLYRIWILSQKNIIMIAILGAGCLTSFGIGVTVSVQISKLPLVTSFAVFTPEVIAFFALEAFFDIAIAGLMCFYLLQGKSTYRRTNVIISRLMQYVVATGLATSMLAFACLIAYVISPDTFIYIAINFSLGRMYTNALLVTLNARRSLRSESSGMRVAPIAANSVLVAGSYSSGTCNNTTEDRGMRFAHNKSIIDVEDQELQDDQSSGVIELRAIKKEVSSA